MAMRSCFFRRWAGAKRLAGRGPLALLLGVAVALALGGCGARAPQPLAGIQAQPGQSLQALIDAAPPGATLLLPRGTWTENLVLEKSLTLRGAGPEATVLAAARPGPPVVWVRGNAEVTLENLAIQEGRGGYLGPARSSAGVFAQDEARVTLVRVHIRNHAASGVFARDEAVVLLQEAVVSGNTRYGLELIGTAKALAKAVQIRENRSGGVWLAEGAALEAEGLEVAANRGPGGWARDAARLRLFGGALRENTGYALHLQDASVAELLGVWVGGHFESGIYVEDGAEVWLWGCTLEGNGNGLELVGGTAHLERCHVQSSRWDGLRARRGTLIAHACRLWGGRGAGVNLAGTARAELHACEIRGFALAGVSGFSAHPVQGRENHFEENGVDLLGHVDPGLRVPRAPGELLYLRVEGPTVLSQAVVDALRPGGVLELGPGWYPAGFVVDKPLEIRGEGAVLVGREEAPVIAGVRGGELRLVGVQLTGGSEGLALGPGSRAELVDCVLWENGAGAKLWGDAVLYAFRTAVARHAQGGLWLWDQAQAELERVTFQSNDLCGIGAAGQSRLVLRRSTLLDNGWQGAVLLRDRAEVELQENLFVNNRGHGIAVLSWACLGTGPGFFGVVRGSGNVFEGNYRGPSCPETLALILSG